MIIRIMPYSTLSKILQNCSLVSFFFHNFAAQERKMTRKFAFCLVTACSIIQLMAQKTIEIKVIETSDVHGCFFPYDFIERKDIQGSLSRACTYIKHIRQKYGDNVILIENGDILQGQPTCYYSNYINPETENLAARVINYMGYNAALLGNHDIETGHAVYDKWIREMNCPTLGANIIDNSTGNPYVTPYIILNKQGIRIAILGMLTPAIPNWLNETIWSGLRFENIRESSGHWIKIIREQEKPDVIIGLFHSGWHGGISTTHYNEDETELTASEVEGFDLIFFGHDHTEHHSIVKNPKGKDVICLNPSCYAMKIAEATIKAVIDKDGRVTIENFTGCITDIRNEAIDEDFVRHFQPDIDKVKSYVDRKIGHFNRTISTRDCFFGSAPFTDFIHNLQLKITGADISFNAPLSFDSSIEEGDVYVSDMFKLYRYENQIYILKMTGKEIRDYLEMSFDLWVNTMKDEKDHIMLLNNNSKPDVQRFGFKNLTFNFDSAAGITYEVDVSKPDGEKVRILSLSDGRHFDEKKWYKVVMNSYRGNGGGELLTKGSGISKDSLSSRILYQSERDQRWYLMNEIEKAKTVTPKANNNWRFVPEKWTTAALKRDRHLIFGIETK